uniref:Neurotransmitter-gated ion-channel transmembrane domain-containing protein n=1 Tax=Romanomermis culicivorax TaxID=13658 RepID=A0A915JHY2_ROMCU
MSNTHRKQKKKDTHSYEEKYNKIRKRIRRKRSYSRLSLRLVFHRLYGHYVLQFYMPLAMLTMLSWLSFWFDRRALTAKLLAGLIPLATATMLTFFWSSPLPQVSYIKAIDVYSGCCLLIIFSSLVECAIASYLVNRVASSDQ